MAGPPAMPKPKPKFVTVRVNDAADLERFIRTLREKMRSSDHAGGVYNVYLPLADGTKLEIEVGLPTRHDRRSG